MRPFDIVDRQPRKQAMPYLENKIWFMYVDVYGSMKYPENYFISHI
jgi:hypothetical protein